MPLALSVRLCHQFPNLLRRTLALNFPFHKGLSKQAVLLKFEDSLLFNI